MASYKMSADTSEKEKVVGGILTAAQGGWLALGCGIIAVLLLGLSRFMPPIIALIIALPPGLAVGLSFAFYKKKELTLFQLLSLKRQFKKKSKIMLNTLTYEKTFREEEDTK